MTTTVAPACHATTSREADSVPIVIIVVVVMVLRWFARRHKENMAVAAAQAIRTEDLIAIEAAPVERRQAILAARVKARADAKEEARRLDIRNRIAFTICAIIVVGLLYLMRRDPADQPVVIRQPTHQSYQYHR